MLAAVLLVAFPLALVAQDAPAIAEGRGLTIGLIGAGNMGGPLGQLLAAAGHQVVYSSRNPAELLPLVESASPRATAAYADAAAYFADVVILAVPPSAVPQLGEDIGQLLRGKIVIDITNPRLDRDGPITTEWLEMGTGLAMAQYLPGTRLVKAFNTLGANMLGNSVRDGVRIGVPIASDDQEAIQVVTQIVRDAGFDPVVVGPLARAKEFDRGTPVWVTGMSAAEVRATLGLD
jgi:predicted dinucleotide-binding enzyme